MAQTNYTPISLYYSTTASAVPTAANLVQGELAINTADGKLYYEDSSGVVQVLATKSTGSIGGSNTQVQFNNSGSLGGSSSFTWDGTTVTATKFAGALNGTVGATTASTGAFTTINASTSITNAGLTSGRVTFAGASGLLSDSANLTYNGTGLGIGGVSATAKLDILNSNATYSLSQKVFNASAGTFFLGQSPSATFLSVDNFAMAFCTNSDGGVAGTSVPTNERMRITSAGDLLVGTTTTRANAGDVQVSKGISFPATQSAQSDANTLDDYEEGTWTATLTPLTSGSITLSASTCAYTKVGRLVTVTGQINTNAASSPLGRLRLGGLPFTSASGTQFESVATIRVVGGVAIIAIDAVVANAGSYIDIYPAGTSTDTYASNINASTSVVFSATYFV